MVFCIECTLAKLCNYENCVLKEGEARWRLLVKQPAKPMCFKEAFLPCYSALSSEEPTYFSPQARLGLTGPWGGCKGRLQFT